MSSSNVQFSVAVHIMAILGYYDDPVKSSTLAKSVAAEPSFVRRSLSKLVKTGLVKATARQERGLNAFVPAAIDISLLEIYRAVLHRACLRSTTTRPMRNARSAATSKNASQLSSMTLREASRGPSPEQASPTSSPTSASGAAKNFSAIHIVILIVAF